MNLPFLLSLSIISSKPIQYFDSVISLESFFAILLSISILSVLGITIYPKTIKKAKVKVNYDETYNANYLKSPKPIGFFRNVSFIKPALFLLILIITITKISELYQVYDYSSPFNHFVI